MGLGEGAGERELAEALEARFGGEPWTLRFQIAPEEQIAAPPRPPAGLEDFAAWGERPGQWFVGRVGYRHPADLLRATRREGGRWTVDCVLRDAALLARAPERCAPAPEPRIDALRRGELELSWSWDGEEVGELRFDRRDVLETMPAGQGAVVSQDGLRTRLPEDGSANAGFARSAAELARGRWQARSLAGIEAAGLETWNARPAWTFDAWVERSGDVAPHFEPSTATVLLAVDGHRGADLRAVGARGEWIEHLGAAADARLEAAVVSASSSAWLGADLEPWIARLHRAGLALSLDELFAPWLAGSAPTGATATGAGSPSPLIREPQLAFACRWYALHVSANGAAWLADVWRGKVQLDLPDADLERRYQVALNALAAEVPAPPAAAGELPWGVCLRLPTRGADWLGAPTLAALEDARSAGARHVQVEVVAWESPGGYDQRPAVSELQWLADRCAERGLGLCLATHFLDAPGRHLLGVEFSGGAEEFAADLDRLEAAAVHFALLAERVDAAWLCLTSETHVWLRTREALDHDGGSSMDDFGRARMAQAAERWPALIARLRGCTRARLTACVASTGALAQFAAWGQLDAASFALFPEHLATPEGYLRDADLEGRSALILERLGAVPEEFGVPLILWGAGASASRLGRTHADLRGGPLDEALPGRFAAALRAALGAEPEAGLLLWDWPVGADAQPRGLGLRGRLDSATLAR